jgi:parallel beta-helix repeat protein
MKSRLLWYSLVLVLPALAIAAAGVLYLQAQGIAPRALAPYIEKRASGHNSVIVAVGDWSARTLLSLDRGEGVRPAPALVAGSGMRVGSAAAGAVRAVSVLDEDSLRRALMQAEPGDVITILPGTYRIRPQPLAASRPGLPDRPVTVRAVAPNTVTLEFQVEEGIKVSAPYWRFENLTLQGVCRIDTDCEHAFHVVGLASHFVAVNNTLVDFNAHFKINGEAGRFPDHGSIEANTIRNTRPRQTANPVTPIDLVGASHWSIRANVISDFVKAGGDGISFGAFAKGGGSDNVFERNIVWCERLLQGQPGQRVGLSLGGGGTLPSLCREGRCIIEQERATLRDNLVLSCSDAGIYLNSAAASKILRNTVLDTAGIQVRYPTSSADLQGNLIDGAIVARDGGMVRAADNIDTPMAYTYFGYHPVRAMFRDFSQLDLAWKNGVAPQREQPDGEAGIDLCGGSARDRYGAFADFSGCVALP